MTQTTMATTNRPTTEKPPDLLSPKSIGPFAEVTIVARVPLAHAWEVFVPIDLAVVFPRRKGPIPPVKATSGQNGRWDKVGRARSVHLGDGTTVREEITFSDPTDGEAPHDGRATFGYMVSGFTGPLGRLAREAQGQWLFDAIEPDKTRITWTYGFVPTGWVGALPLRLIISTFWRAYMRDGIRNLCGVMEKTARVT